MGAHDKLRAANQERWGRIFDHPFVQALGRGDLGRRRFRFYLAQDALYLGDYARAMAVAGERAADSEQAAAFGRLARLTLEVELPQVRAACRSLGPGDDELDATGPGLVTVAYAGHLLRCARQGSTADMAAALLPCAAGYLDIATRLAARGLPEEPLYRGWIQAYMAPEMAEVAAWLEGILEAAADGAGDADRRRWAELYALSVRLELAFFDMCWACEPWPWSTDHGR